MKKGTPQSVRLSPESVKAYRGILKKQIENLRAAADASDIARVLEICHKIKGSSALFGNEALGTACGAVEGIELAEDSEFMKVMVQRVVEAAAPQMG